MKVNNKIISFIIICIFLSALSFSSYVGKFSSGSISRNKLLKNNEPLYAKGNNIEITQSDMVFLTKVYQTTHPNQAEEMAFDYLAKERALYHAAIEAGYTVTQEEIDSYVKNMQESYEIADNKEDLDAFLSNFDSIDDYWDYLTELLEIELPSKKYLDDLEVEYFQKIKSAGDDEDTYHSWEDAAENIKKNLVKEEDIKIIKD